MGNLIEQQAIDFANVPIIQRHIKATVHLEDWEDVLFWDTMMQHVAPGLYNYVAYSKADSGQDASGCDQCLKYVPFLSKRFFICIDSDMRYLMTEPALDADHYICQTYSYSWENHYCEGRALQVRLENALPNDSIAFDFNSFLSEYSSIVYRPFLALLYCLRSNDKRITRKGFRDCMPNQARAKDIADNGKELLDMMGRNFSTMLETSGVLDDIDFDMEVKHYQAMGLTESNAYLHVRGHNLYNLLKSIGRQISSGYNVDFENQILNASLPAASYWELKEVASDLMQIVI